MNKKLLSIILFVSMMLNIVMPHIEILASDVSGTGQSKIIEQLKEDLGEEKTEEVFEKDKKDDSNTDELKKLENNDDYFAEKDELQNSDKNEIENNGDKLINVDESASNIENIDLEIVEYAEESTQNDDFDGIIVASDSIIEMTNDFYTGDIEDVDTVKETDLFGGLFDDYECYWYIADDVLYFANTETDDYLSSDEEKRGNFTTIGSYLNEPPADLREHINTIVFTENIKFWICSNLFKDYKNLTEIIGLDKMNTQVCSSMQNMFYGCERLETLDLSSFNTSNVENMSMMFCDCHSLNSINLVNIDTAKVTSMQCMFYNCNNLISLDLSGFDTSRVITMSEMFSGCNSLSNLDISNFNTTNVIRMHEMFYRCSSLENIDVSSFDTSNVQDMDRIFASCHSLRQLDISNFNTSNVEAGAPTLFSGYFSGCSNLESIELGNFDTSKMENLSNMFYGCEKLRSLDLSSFDTREVTDMSRMFYGCEELEKLDLSSFNTSKVETLSYMFENCRNLKKILVNNSFDLGLVSSNTRVFNGCVNLVGGNVTIYNSSKIGKEYAIIDGENGRPGYFTNKLDGDRSIIIYHLKGGQWINNYVASVSIAHLNELILSTKDNVEYNAHKFIGWYDNAQLSGEAITKIDSCTEDIYNIYAKWIEWYKVDEDGWHFENYQVQIDKKLVYKVLGEAEGKRLGGSDYFATNGVCYGMSGLSKDFFDSKFNFTLTYPNKQNLSQVDKTGRVKKVKDEKNQEIYNTDEIIQLAYLYQFTKAAKDHDKLQAVGPANNWKNINDIKECLNSNNVCTLSIFYGGVAHTILAYDYVDESDYDYIMLYDCNYPNDDTCRIRLKSYEDGKYDWYYDRYGEIGYERNGTLNDSIEYDTQISYVDLLNYAKNNVDLDTRSELSVGTKKERLNFSGVFNNFDLTLDSEYRKTVKGVLLDENGDIVIPTDIDYYFWLCYIY